MSLRQDRRGGLPYSQVFTLMPEFQYSKSTEGEGNQGKIQIFLPLIETGSELLYCIGK